jgi:hypothetical protein
VLALFDHEEVRRHLHCSRLLIRCPQHACQVGSNSHQGAGSLQLGDNLARITRSLFPDAPVDAHQVQAHRSPRRIVTDRQPGDGHTLLRGQHGHGAWCAPELRREARGAAQTTAAAGRGHQDQQQPALRHKLCVLLLHQVAGDGAMLLLICVRVLRCDADNVPTVMLNTRSGPLLRDTAFKFRTSSFDKMALAAGA